MPSEAYVKITMSGQFGDSAHPWEIWTSSLAMSELPAQQQNDVAIAVMAYFTDVRTKIASHVYLDDISIAYMGANHRQVGETIHAYRVPIVQGGGGASAVYPPQIAMRVSLGSGQRGRSQRGGFYLPTVAMPISNQDGLVQVAQADDLVESSADFLKALNAIGPGKVVIPSSTAGNVVVNQVRIGRALDTIRRRRNDLVEDYRVSSLG